jgi:short chain dehydrogenase
MSSMASTWREESPSFRGGYSGLGRETARILLGAGARVIVPARDVPRATTALAAVPGVEVEAMDLLDPGSIDAFAERFVADAQPPHLLVSNAALAGPVNGIVGVAGPDKIGLDDLVRRFLKKTNAPREVVSDPKLSISLFPVWGFLHIPAKRFNSGITLLKGSRQTTGNDVGNRQE